MKAFDEKLKDHADLDGYLSRIIELQAKLNDIRLLMNPLAQELRLYRNDSDYEREREQAAHKLKEMKLHGQTGVALDRQEKLVADMDRDQKRKKELRAQLKALAKSVKPLQKEQEKLYAEIVKIRKDYELEKMQPELRLQALKNLESNACMSAQIHALIGWLL